MSAGAARALTSSGLHSHFELFGLAPAFGLDVTVGAVQMSEIQRVSRIQAKQLEMILQNLRR